MPFALEWRQFEWREWDMAPGDHERWFSLPRPRRAAYLHRGAPELDCLRSTLAPDLLRAARQRADELGLGADQVLINWGVIDQVGYLRRLSAHLGIETETFRDVERAETPLHDHQMRYAAAAGLMPLRQDGELRWTVAPRLLAARTLCSLVAAYPSVRARMRISTDQALQRFLQQQGGGGLAAFAAWGLQQRYPSLSAAPIGSGEWAQLKRGLGALLVAVLIIVAAMGSLHLLPAVLFLLFVGFRLAASLCPARPPLEVDRQPDHVLPIYTVIAALYREARSVGSLVQAIEALDYPREKLDVILVIEPDDLQTRAAIARLGARPHLRVLVAPAVGPRTKPKALNYALPFARGSVVAVYDAEDRPAPDQLRAAVAALMQGGPRTG